MDRITITLPWPPSANTYWRTTQHGRMYPSKKAKDYIQTVRSIIQNLMFQPFHPGQELIAEYRVVYPADKRSARRDLGNCEKVLSDALQAAGLIPDDNQLHRIVLERLPVDGDGRVEITLKTLQNPHSEDEGVEDMHVDVFGI
jgi:crossover junction endodeoxyribonuclease RusA